MFRRLLSALLAVALASVLWPAAAAAYAPSPGATFNRPQGTTAQRFALVNKVDSAIAHTRKGATILITTYLMDRGRTTDKLLAAHRRGVNVRVVMDEQIESGAARRLARKLGQNTSRRSFVVFCHNSCRSNRGDMHTKFYAFSKTGRAKNVVMVSSANLNAGGALLGWNDLFTMVGQERIYKKYAAIHAQMARDRPVQPPRARYVVHRVGRFESQFLPKPTASRATDPVYQAMDRIRCRGVAGGAGTKGRTTINVSMFWWSGERGMYLANKLLSLQRAGCRVNVIYGAPSNQVAALLRAAAWKGRINLYDSRHDRNYDGLVDLRVHTKYMAVSGRYAGDRSSWQVLTGSANWVAGSLTGGDELLLRVSSRPAYASYLANFRDVKAQSRKIGR